MSVPQAPEYRPPATASGAAQARESTIPVMNGSHANGETMDTGDRITASNMPRDPGSLLTIISDAIAVNSSGHTMNLHRAVNDPDTMQLVRDVRRNQIQDAAGMEIAQQRLPENAYEELATYINYQRGTR
jgi:hypothetical protein